MAISLAGYGGVLALMAISLAGYGGVLSGQIGPVCSGPLRTRGLSALDDRRRHRHRDRALAPTVLVDVLVGVRTTVVVGRHI